MRILIIFLFALLISGCGIFKKSSRDILKENSETRIENKNDSVGIIVDKSKIVIKEKADTSILTKEEKTEATSILNMDSLVNGLTAISNDLVDVKMVLDTSTNKLTTTVTIKPRPITFHIDKTTTIDRDYTQKSKIDKGVLVSEKKNIKKFSVKKEPNKIGVWLIGVVVAIAGIVYYLLKKFRIF